VTWALCNPYMLWESHANTTPPEVLCLCNIAGMCLAPAHPLLPTVGNKPKSYRYIDTGQHTV